MSHRRKLGEAIALTLFFGACTTNSDGLDFEVMTNGGTSGTGGGSQGQAGTGGSTMGSGGNAGAAGAGGTAQTGGAPKAGGSGGAVGGAGGTAAGGVGGKSGMGGRNGGSGGVVGGAGGVGGGAGGGGAGGVAGGAGGLNLAMVLGCSDATREGFFNPANFPNIAACSGGWSVPGVTPVASPNATCNRVAGNSSANPTGKDCAVEDLCANGWHVCTSAADVMAHSPIGCFNSDAGFWVTRQTANTDCTPPPNSNNLVGCGYDPYPSGGANGPPGNCSPMNRMWTYRECDATGGVWACNTNPGEGATVVKTQPQLGGVICCRN